MTPDENTLMKGHPTPYFLFNKQKLIDNLNSYKIYLPGESEICYAMKANSEDVVLKTLHESGASFEVASKYELELLKDIGVPASNIIFGSSVKQADHIVDFVEYGVDRFAFDTEEELIKIAKYSPRARVYVRALVDDKSDSVFKMSEKFGAFLNDAESLLLKAKNLGLITYGISFNVGSQSRNVEAWARGINEITEAMKRLLNSGVIIEVINIGGGFPFSYNEDTFPKIEEIAKHINEAMKSIPYEVKLIAEPGRGLVADVFSLVASVISKNLRANGHWLYINVGVYNALLEAMTCQGSIRYKIESLTKIESPNTEKYILTGPTGDNLDVISHKVSLPSDIKVGDKILIHDTGAYTFPLMTKFNGFPKPVVIEP